MKKHPIRSASGFGRSVAMLALVLLATSAGPVISQQYPARPIRMVVAFPPGGGTDAVARILAPKLGESLGTIVIDNRDGASGTIGTAIVARATPDGYTVFLGTLGNLSVNPLLFKKLPFDIARDFDPVTRVVNVTFVLYAYPGLAASSVKELVALAKSRNINYASSGNGGAPHLAAELFNSMAKIKMTHVPYKGGGPAFTALLGGQIDVFFSNIPVGLAHIRSGKLRALGVLTPGRSPILPDVPTVAESVPGYEILNWFGMVVPKGTPAGVVRRLHADTTRALREPEVMKRLTALGAEPIGDSPKEFGAFMKAEKAKWATLIREAKIASD